MSIRKRGYLMSAHVLLYVLKLGIEIKCEALLSILSLFRNKFNKLKNIGTQMFNSV